MKGSSHVCLSAVLGGVVYAVSQSAVIALTSFLSGFLIDLDHVLDFLILSGEKFSFKDMTSWCHEGRWDKIYLFLHSYELYLLLGIITYYHQHPLLIGLMLGTGFHLILDQIWNCFLRKGFRLLPSFYFLTRRYFLGFHRDKTMIIVPDNSQQ